MTFQMCSYTTLCLIKTPQHGVSLIAPLIRDVAGLSASSSSDSDTLNIWCRNCRMWQLLYTISETI